MPSFVDLARRELAALQPPSWAHLAGIALALLLGGLLPLWLALQLAVAPNRAMRVDLGTHVVQGLALAPNSVASLRARFARYGFDLAGIAAGERDVPALFVRRLPGDWHRQNDAQARKRTFIKVVLPLVLRENGRVLADRARLLRLRERSDGDLAALPTSDRAWLDALAERYDAEPGDWQTLLRRVDEIPVSLALVQAAKESGWGTSRFARRGNALFGQWTWTPGQGIAPKERQEGKGAYAVRAFKRLGHSVAAYLQNLNTHPAYRQLRVRRANLRAAGQRPGGLALAGGLTRYSQRGQAYVEEVRSMIRRDRFQRYDDARLVTPATS